MESWDAEDFEPPVIIPARVTSNKWEGEDEDDEVKESWEDEEEEGEPKEQDEKPAEPVKTKPKKKLQEKIADKERKKREEYERQLREQEEEEEKEISPEEKLKRQQESDLKIALETTFGDALVNDSSGLNFNASTKEELDELAEQLIKKLQPASKSTEYPAFAENVVRDLCVTLSSFDIKKIKNTIDNLYLEKQKIEKGDKAKKNKGKAKAKIKVEDANQYSAYVDNYDYDDFM